MPTGFISMEKGFPMEVPYKSILQAQFPCLSSNISILVAASKNNRTLGSLQLKMSSQKVFRLTSRGRFEDVQGFSEPIPTVDKREVLIKVRSVALNYRDVAIATSKYPLPVKDNVIPCSDMAGEVAQMGDLVEGFSIGDRVIAPINLSLLYGPCKDVSDTFGGPKDGMLREYIALPVHAIIKLPESTHGFAEWAAVITTGSTVWNAFYGNTPLKLGDMVLVLGRIL